MIAIEKTKVRTKVFFSKTNPSGRVTTNHIETTTANSNHDEEAYINIPALNLQPSDIPEFIEAIELANKIASGKVEIK